MNNFILIKVENNINRFINKCNKYNIELYNITYISKNEIIVKVLKNDIKNIERYNYYSNISIYKKLGKDNLIDKIIKQKYIILTFIFCLIAMYFISNIIFDIEIIHSNKKIRELVNEELINNGIKKYSYKKEFKDIELIKNNILENNKDKLEWISITNIGMKYIIRVEERILDNIIKEDDYCNIISTKDALITNIYGIKGDILIKVNDYVRKNDTLISGDLLLNEEIKDTTCANGTIYGKVWYNSKISLKRTYIKKEYTGNDLKELMDTFGFKESDVIFTSGKTGVGVDELMEAIVARVPSPEEPKEDKLKCLIFKYSKFHSLSDISLSNNKVVSNTVLSE